MNLIDGGLFDNIPIKPLLDKNYDIYAIDLFAKDNEIALQIVQFLIKIAHFLCRNFLLFHQNFFEENQVQEFCLLV